MSWREFFEAGQVEAAGEALERELDEGDASFPDLDLLCLRELVAHPDTRLRQQALRALGRAGDLHSIAALATVFDRALDFFDHDFIFEAFKAMGEPAVTELTRIADVGTPGERCAALQGLGVIGGSGVPVLLEAAWKGQDDDTVYGALFNARDPRAVLPLVEIIESGRLEGEPLEMAGDALAESCDPRCDFALEPLIRLAKTHVDLRDDCYRALGNIGDPRALPILAEALKLDSGAAAALEKIADPGAVCAL